MLKEKKGLALIAAIMLMVFVLTAVLGLSVFIVGWYKQMDTAEREVRCIYNALAGINYAIYQYRVSGALTNGTIPIDANNNFTLSTVSGGGGGGGGAAAGLVIDARSASLSANNRDLLNVTLKNDSSTSFTINQATVDWDSNRNMRQILINNVTNWSGNANMPPETVDFTTNATIGSGVTVPLTRVRWNNSVSGNTITISFRMTDGSTTSPCTIYPAQASTCVQSSGNLTIQSMGKTAGSNQWRSIQAMYDTTTGNVSDYYEIATIVL